MQDLSYKSALISNMLIGGRVSKALIMVIYIEDVQAHLRRSGCRSGVPLDPGLNLVSTLNRLQSHDITRLTPISCLENDSEQKCKCSEDRFMPFSLFRWAEPPIALGSFLMTVVPWHKDAERSQRHSDRQQNNRRK
jgi:hypothetical protein